MQKGLIGGREVSCRLKPAAVISTEIGPACLGDRVVIGTPFLVSRTRVGNEICRFGNFAINRLLATSVRAAILLARRVTAEATGSPVDRFAPISTVIVLDWAWAMPNCRKEGTEE